MVDYWDEQLEYEQDTNGIIILVLDMLFIMEVKQLGEEESMDD